MFMDEGGMGPDHDPSHCSIEDLPHYEALQELQLMALDVNMDLGEAQVKSKSIRGTKSTKSMFSNIPATTSGVACSQASW